MVVHSYEAILLYATLVLSTNAEGSNYLSGRTLVNRLINMNVTSPLTGKIHYDTNGEREIAYVMRNFNEDTGKHEVSYSSDRLLAIFVRSHHPCSSTFYTGSSFRSNGAKAVPDAVRQLN